MPIVPQSARITVANLMILVSIPKYSARPAQTPKIILLSESFNCFDIVLNIKNFCYAKIVIIINILKISYKICIFALCEVEYSTINEI